MDTVQVAKYHSNVYSALDRSTPIVSTDWNNVTLGDPALLAQVLKVCILPQTYAQQVDHRECRRTTPHHTQYWLPHSANP